MKRAVGYEPVLTVENNSYLDFHVDGVLEFPNLQKNIII
jgi:hypothetical protein